MKQNFTLAGALILLIFFSSCEQYRCIKGDDNFTVETRSLNNTVDRIFVESSYDLYITQDTVLSMTVEADENLMPYIVTDEIDRDLILTTANDRCVRSRNDIRVNLSVPDISKLVLQGSGDVRFGRWVTGNDMTIENNGSGLIYGDYLFADNLIVDILGSGDIILEKVDVINLDIYTGGSGDIEIIEESQGHMGYFVIDGSGDIIADLIRLEELNMNIAGSGDITCWVERLIYGEISGSGNLYYRAFPLNGIRIDVIGSGEYFPL